MSKNESRPKSDTVPSKPSLVEFMRSKAKEGCLVCKLPPAVRAQLGPAATKKGYSRLDQVEWLKEAVGAKGITLDILNTHLNQKHDLET